LLTGATPKGGRLSLFGGPFHPPGFVGHWTPDPTWPTMERMVRASIEGQCRSYTLRPEPDRALRNFWCPGRLNSKPHESRTCTRGLRSSGMKAGPGSICGAGPLPGGAFRPNDPCANRFLYVLLRSGKAPNLAFFFPGSTAHPGALAGFFQWDSFTRKLSAHPKWQIFTALIGARDA